MNIQIRCNAKLNLYLRVYGVREDGLHDLNSIMQSVHLTDILKIEDTGTGKIELECTDPEIPVDVVELGLIYSCDLNTDDQGQRNVMVMMTLTAPGCGMGEILVQDAQEKIVVIPTISDVRVELVFDPPWNQSMMSDEARLQTGLM